MDKKTIWLLGGVLLLAIGGIVILNPFKQKNLSSSENLNLAQSAPITFSKTTKTYTDPSGFSFIYPDNLSLLNNELKDENSYAELQLTASGASGSLVLKIADSKLVSLDEWSKSKNSNPTEAPKEMKLGNLKAQQVKNNDKLILGALDQGILFTIEVPQGKDADFWMKVLNIVMADFAFAPPQAAGDSGTTDISFDGEEVVQ